MLQQILNMSRSQTWVTKKWSNTALVVANALENLSDSDNVESLTDMVVAEWTADEKEEAKSG